MKQGKIKVIEKKYAKPISLYPLKVEDAISAIMKISHKKILARERRVKKSEREKIKENTIATNT